jgi:Fic family protein
MNRRWLRRIAARMLSFGVPKLRDVPLNGRQRLVIHRLIDGFEGKLTPSKWAALTKSSQDTALRDIQQLVERGVLVRNEAGGRSTSYSLAPL